MSIEISYFPAVVCVRDESASFTLDVHIYARFTSQYICVANSKGEKRCCCCSQWVDAENRRADYRPDSKILINGRFNCAR